MNEPKKFSLESLVKLSQADGAIERVEREKKQLARELEERKKTVAGENTKYRERLIAFKKLKESIITEEKSIKEENEKLKERRKALNSFSNYKLQQAAQKEIETAGKQVSVREEALLKVMESAEDLEKNVKDYEEVFKSAQDAFNSLFSEAKNKLLAMEDRLFKQLSERNQLVLLIPKDILASYDRVRQRHTENPMVPLKNRNSCSGCYMQIGPQLIVQISKGNSLVKCPGCSRIIYIVETEEE